jgi:outer membrane protein
VTIKSSILAVLLAGSAAGLATGAQAADLKIGYIKTSTLLQKSPQAQAASTDMAKRFDQRKKDLDAQMTKIKNLEDDLSRNGATMSAQQAQEEQNQHDELQRDASRKQSDLMDDFNVARNAALNSLQQAMMKAAQEFAQSQKYSLILADNVVYADSAIDVTDQVLAQMQKDYKASGDAKGGN